MRDPAAKAPDNVVPFPSRRARAPSVPASGSPTGPHPPRSAPPKVSHLPVARPASRPPPFPRRKEADSYCEAGNACLAFPALNSPAKLSRHNREKIGGKRYCYLCRSAIAGERSRSVKDRKDSEAAAARRHKERCAAGAQQTPKSPSPPVDERSAR